MKILTNKSIRRFILKLKSEPLSSEETLFRITTALSFITWLEHQNELSNNDALRFKNELYTARRSFTQPKAPRGVFPLKYVGFSLAVLSLFLIGGGIYLRLSKNVKTPLAFSSAPLRAGRTINFQGRLTDTLGNPITAPIDVTYKFYSVPTGGSVLTDSTRVCTASPDQDGIFNTLIGNDTGGTGGTLCNVELPSSLFTENANVYLGVTIGTEITEMSPRQQIANVGYAINSETLQGMPPGSSVSSVPFINSDGNMLIAAANPGLRSLSSSNFTISSALATTIQSAGAGDITLSATGGGALRFNTYNGTLEERLTVLNTGRVGIGTTAPRALLDVNGDATVSGSLVAGGQIKIGDFNAAPANIGNGSLYYDNSTNKVYYWNGTAWTDMGGGGTQYFQRTAGSLAPTNITDALNLGAVATASALVHMPGTNNQDAWFNLGTGNIGIGNAAPTTKLDITGGLKVSSYATMSASLGLGTSSAAPGHGNLSMSGDLTISGALKPGGNAGANGYLLTSSGGGVNTWTDPTTLSGSNYFQRTAGSLAPINITDSLNLGATATTSALVHFAGTINENSFVNTGNFGIGLNNPSYLTDISSTSSLRALNISNIQTTTSDVYGSYANTSVTDGSYSSNSFGGYFHSSQNGGNDNFGVYGLADSMDPGGDSIGVYGQGDSGYGIYGYSASNIGVYGRGSVIGGKFFSESTGVQIDATGTTPSGLKINSVGTTSSVGINSYSEKTNATAAITKGITNTVLNSGITTTGTDVTYGNYIDVSRTSATGGTLNTYGEFITLSSLDNAGAGTHTAYGLYLGNVTGADTNYSIYSNGGNSYYAGSIGVGITPTYKLDVVGDVNLTGAIRTNGGAGTTGYVLTSAAGGLNTWTDPAILGTNYWNIGSGSIYPVNTTLDAFIGGTASSSAKFAFINANANTPTASISGSIANVRTFLTGDGNLATTNMQALTLGGASTGPIQLSPKNTTGLFVSGTGSVGVGNTVPGALLDIGSAGSTLGTLRLEGNTSGYVQLQTAAAAGSWTLTLPSDDGTASGLVLSTNGSGVTSWTDVNTLVISPTQYWQRTLGSLAPLNITDALNLGNTATSSALVHFPGTNNQDAWLNLGTGNVGIGTAAPTAGYKLDVNGKILATEMYDKDNVLFYVNPGGASSFSGNLTLGADLTAVNATLSGTLTLGSNQAVRAAYSSLYFDYKNTPTTWAHGMTLADTGRVGIGTTNPDYALDVVGNIKLSSGLIAGTNGAGVSGYVLTSSGGGVNTWTDVNTLVSIPSQYWQLASGVVTPTNITNALNLGNTATASALVHFPGTNNQDAWFNLGTGNVGIGRVTPGAKLDVAGTASISGVLTLGTGAVNTLQTAYGPLTLNYKSGLNAWTAGITLQDSTGNVGIGTTTPSSLLDISDNGHINMLTLRQLDNDATTYGIRITDENSANDVFYIRSQGLGSDPVSMYINGTASASGTLTVGNGTTNTIQSAYGPLTLNYKSGLNAWTAGLTVKDGSGAVGIGTTNPTSGSLLDVRGRVLATEFYDFDNASYYVNPAGATSAVLNGNITLGGDITMLGGAPTITTNNGGTYTQIVLKGSNDTTSTAVCIEGTGTGGVCDGKLNVGTVDPPYTINGKKYATYLPSMTGVKEETTGKFRLTEKNDAAHAYTKTIQLTNQPEGSDLWLFAKTTSIQQHIQDLAVLLSSNTNGKVWYSIDETSSTLTLYSSTPTELSYRLTAPRFDSEKWANARPESDNSTGFVLNDGGNIASSAQQVTQQAPTLSKQYDGIFSLIGSYIEEFTSAQDALFAKLTTGILSAQKITSPLIETESLKASTSVEAPRFTTASLEVESHPGQLASLIIKGLHDRPVVQIDSLGNATFAGTLTAELVQSQKSKVESLEAENASVSGTLVAKNIQSETLNQLSSQLASSSSTLTTNYQLLSTHINSVQQELASIKSQPLPNPAYYQNLDASYGNLTVQDTANIYKAHIADSLVVGTLFIQPSSILALASDLHISSLSTVRFFNDAVIIAKNGDITSKGEVSANSLAIKNTDGQTVASIDASGSAHFTEVIAKKFTLETIATQGALIADSGVRNSQNEVLPGIQTETEVAGTGTLPQDMKEIVIYNKNITDNSLIYLTPTTDNIQGQLSVTKKMTCSPGLSCSPYFIVSSSSPIHSTTTFNWLIIN